MHVRDIANPDSAQQKRQVLSVLHDLGVVDEAGEGVDAPVIEVWNKWDLLDADAKEDLAALAVADDAILPISAITGEGVDALQERLGAVLTEGARTYSIVLSASDGARIAWLHAHGEVLSEGDAGEGEGAPKRRIEVRLTDKEYGRYEAL